MVYEWGTLIAKCAAGLDNTVHAIWLGVWKIERQICWFGSGETELVGWQIGSYESMNIFLFSSIEFWDCYL